MNTELKVYRLDLAAKERGKTKEDEERDKLRAELEAMKQKAAEEERKRKEVEQEAALLRKASVVQPIQTMPFNAAVPPPPPIEDHPDSPLKNKGAPKTFKELEQGVMAQHNVLSVEQHLAQQFSNNASAVQEDSSSDESSSGSTDDEDSDSEDDEQNNNQQQQAPPQQGPTVCLVMQ